MTNDEIRIAVAEELGWELAPIAQNKLQKTWQRNGVTQELPDFPNDLNACHEMEKTLEDPEIHRERYRLELNLACGFGRSWKDSECNPEIAHATARQRCEAFLRVKGKWQ